MKLAEVESNWLLSEDDLAVAELNVLLIRDVRRLFIYVVLLTPGGTYSLDTLHTDQEQRPRGKPSIS